jgi:hypothetical protein
MPKFKQNDRVRKIGSDEVRTVIRVLELKDKNETVYETQFGPSVRTREWAKESELERA